ncbi:hypothetical protein DY000_02028580 [Brassica cretica]|uniref:Uncharacterized protein n=1 Tax=Brassica cretica TaxID=69181 RepID=A0ABQ7DXD4_BRACR|nr:hypothetical protein DY000_02028580 [Brassica cretica]
MEWRLDGVVIGRSCCKLSKFEIQGCENVTVKGVSTMVTLLRNGSIAVRTWMQQLR